MHFRLLSSALLGVAAIALVAAVLSPAEADPVSSPLDFVVKNIDGKTTPLAKYKGKVVLIVNTASKCGFTPQYASLETLYGKYKKKGLKILAFPSNDFGQQEPGSETEIKQFCSLKYKTTFDLFSKVATKGDNAAPLYRWLTGKDTNPQFAGDIEWNFTKFLVDKKGTVIARFASNVDPLSPEFEKAIETALNN